MKANVKLYTNDGKSPNGYPVKVIITHQKKIKRKTLAHVPEDLWDEVRQVPKPSHPDFESLYTRILEIRAKAVSYKFYELEDVKLAMDFLLDIPNKKKIIDFYTFQEQYCEYMRSVDREGNAISFEDAVKQFKKVAPKLEFVDLNPALVNAFKVNQRKKGNKAVTIRKYLAAMRAIYNAGVEQLGLDNQMPFKGAFRDLKVRVRRQRNRYLERSEINKLKNANLDQVSYQRAVDLALLMFYLGGLDFKDLYYLKKSQIHNDRIFFERIKLGDRGYEFDVKCFPETWLLMEKYPNDDMESDYVFPWRKTRASYDTFINNLRRDMAKVKELLDIKLSPKNETFTPKVMRHTFATMGKFAHIEEDLLRELMGHERNDIDTAYKDKYPEKERDAAQKLILEL
ncbi:phage integrase SAM-like domain-containing protein [Galbibacter sp. BG1]|uniref:tyrosine-type recombinase/integrase n=1 Tax=Galbibacter sp. BG1 TaxID=1170699 RepID=UPI0015BF46F7|nr:phage integrase SAM-like domain-containing protein [Galbibacter sp. BG1]QLE02913.1 phage integrase SAM-like domain-containing protein [Galbibacter sp. BG1]